jgi:hypothetical protein
VQGSSSTGTPTAAVVNRPADGAVRSSQASSSVEQVVPSGTSSSRTCHAVWRRVAVSIPIAFSISSGSSRAVTSRRHTSRYARYVPLVGSGAIAAAFGKYGCFS